MDDQILDQLEKPSYGKYYQKSRVNLKAAGISLGIGIGGSFICGLIGFRNDLIFSILGLFILVSFFIGLGGAINGVRSYLKKEDAPRYRLIILICNLGLFLTLVIILIVNILDAIRQLNG